MHECVAKFLHGQYDTGSSYKVLYQLLNLDMDGHT